VTAWAVAAAHNPGLVVRRMQALHTVLERNPEEADVPTEVDHMEAVEAGHVVHMAAAEVVAPIVVVHKVIEAVHMEAVEAAQAVHKVVAVVDSDLAAAVGLDHKT